MTVRAIFFVDGNNWNHALKEAAGYGLIARGYSQR